MVVWLVVVALGAGFSLGMITAALRDPRRHVTAVRPGGIVMSRKPLSEAQLAAFTEALAEARAGWTGRWNPVPDNHGLHHPIMREEVSGVPDECELCKAGVSSGNHTCGR